MLSRISLLAAALLLAGCESGSNSNQGPVQTGAQPADAATATVQSARSAETAQTETGGNTVPDGTLEIRILDTGVTITAKAVSQQTILYRLATQAGFGVKEAGVPWKVVTQTIKAENLHAALVALLKQYPYQIVYEFDAERQADTLKRVVVGTLLAGQECQQPTPAADSGMSPDIPEYKILNSPTEASLSAEDQAYLKQLMDPSPEVREDAASNIDPTGIALDHLASIVTTDPSPDVRIAAAETLGDSKDPKALDALVLALQDENPEVLVEVIDALVSLENRRVIPYLQPLLQHPDEDVRDAAEYALEQFD